MSSFVLVHGAWSGAMSWHKVAPLLRARGHGVFAPSLTGLGDRVHLGGPETNLTTHVRDVVALVEYEDLREIVLVGHSYGGMVITGAIDSLADRIAHLVYIDAFLPSDGQSLRDLGGATDAPIVDGWRIGRLPRMLPAPPGGTEFQPIGTFEEKVRLTSPLEERGFSRTYVKAGGTPGDQGERNGAFWRAAQRVRDDPRWRYFELPAGHRLQRELPESVAGILLDLVATEG